MKLYYRPDHPKASKNGFVREDELWIEQDTKAIHAPIMMDRFYENTKATDGTDIGSRRKHREYMKRHGLAMADDFKETWKRDAEVRERMQQGDFDRKGRREDVARAFYERTRG